MQIAKGAGYLRILLWRLNLERLCQYLIEQGAFLVHRKNLGKSTWEIIDKPQNIIILILPYYSIYIILILSSTRRERGDRRNDKNKQCK